LRGARQRDEAIQHRHREVVALDCFASLAMTTKGGALLVSVVEGGGVVSETGIFSGLKVIDAASFIAAPAAATILADFGAEVIKVEPTGAGDAYRAISFQPGLPVADTNYCWTVDARNKRSLALDLKRPEAQQILHRLIAGADVFITNYPPPARRRLGIGYAQVKHINPRLIYASLTAYGEHGAEADKPGFDSTAWWARSGMMDQVRPDAESLPARSIPGMGDHPTALALYGAIVTALFRRERSGQGGYVGSSLMASGVWANACFVQAGLDGARFVPRPPRSAALNALSNHYRCRDDRWLILSISPAQDEKSWPLFAETIGRPELAQDALFASRPLRLRNARALTALLDEVFLHRDAEAWMRLLESKGFIVALVARASEALYDRQMHDNGAIVPMQGGGYTVSSPLWIDGAEKAQAMPAPDVGEHSDAILREHGIAPDEIARLRADGVVG
jgi:crotonobetainyl-CoA:carnitine CoA-transferase CaiB-like acyl-CoA transferase